VARAFAEARQHHGQSELLDEIVAAKPRSTARATARLRSSKITPCSTYETRSRCSSARPTTGARGLQELRGEPRRTSRSSALRGGSPSARASGRRSRRSRPPWVVGWSGTPAAISREAPRWSRRLNGPGAAPCRGLGSSRACRNGFPPRSDPSAAQAGDHNVGIFPSPLLSSHVIITMPDSWYHVDASTDGIRLFR